MTGKHYLASQSFTIRLNAAADMFEATIFSAVKKAGVRALVSAGWGGIGGASIPENIFILGNVPHDWLFDKVAAVCHHGGAGTTAIGLRMGKPTIIVPFFGDQPFWGASPFYLGCLALHEGTRRRNGPPSGCGSSADSAEGARGGQLGGRDQIYHAAGSENCGRAHGRTDSQRGLSLQCKGTVP